MQRPAAFALSLGVVTLTSSALAEPLVVAAEPAPAPITVVAPPPAPSPVVVAPPPAPRPADTAPRPRRSREGTELGGSLTAIGALAVDDGEPGAMVRASLDLYVSVGLGEVSVLFGAPVMVIESSMFPSHAELGLPLMLTTGLRSDRWMALAAVGVAVSGDVTSEVPAEPEPSPRVELRGGPRFDDDLEVCAYASYERHNVAGVGDSDRFFAGVSIGYGGDG